MFGHQGLPHHPVQSLQSCPLLQLCMDLWRSRKTQGQAGKPHTQEVHHLGVRRERSAAQPAVFMETALVSSPDLWRVSERASLLAV